jgi:predicted nucleotidyltransferase
MILNTLVEKKLATPPRWLPENLHYLTIMGSEAYGVSSGDSDKDLYGFCVPPKEMIWPHLAGAIPGFGRQPVSFEQYQQHGIKHTTDREVVYDFSIYSIVKYFNLCMENNPNMIDSLFTPQSCVIWSTPMAVMVRNNRQLFLHKGAYPKFKGYAYSQLHKMAIKQPQEGGKRAANVEEHGYDTKFAYHLVRLLNEVEQLLMTGTLDLQQSREMLKEIRRGGWTEEQVRVYFSDKERQLDELYVKSGLRPEPDEAVIKQLLVDCLEHHYGSLAGCVVEPDAAWNALAQIEEIIARTRRG